MRRRRIWKVDGNPEMEKWIDTPLIYLFTLTHSLLLANLKSDVLPPTALVSIGHSGSVSCFCIFVDSGKT